MLQSNETIQLIGFQIRIRVIGLLMNNDYVGGYGASGQKSIPKLLGRKGIGCHPKLIKYGEPDAPCGMLAILLAYDSKKYLKDYSDWGFTARAMSTEIGIDPSTKLMQNMDFKKLFVFEGWSDLRIVVLRPDGFSEYTTLGPEWVLPKVRDQRDPRTLYILRHPLDSHYYWLQFPTQTMFGRKTLSKNRYIFILFFFYYYY